MLQFVVLKQIRVDVLKFMSCFKLQLKTWLFYFPETFMIPLSLDLTVMELAH